MSLVLCENVFKNERPNDKKYPALLRLAPAAGAASASQATAETTLSRDRIRPPRTAGCRCRA